MGQTINTCLLGWIKTKKYWICSFFKIAKWLKCFPYHYQRECQARKFPKMIFHYGNMKATAPTCCRNAVRVGVMIIPAGFVRRSQLFQVVLIWKQFSYLHVCIWQSAYSYSSWVGSKVTSHIHCFIHWSLFQQIPFCVIWDKCSVTFCRVLWTCCYWWLLMSLLQNCKIWD